MLNVDAHEMGEDMSLNGVRAYLYRPDAADYGASEQPAWRQWLDGLAFGAEVIRQWFEADGEAPSVRNCVANDGNKDSCNQHQSAYPDRAGSGAIVNNNRAHVHRPNELKRRR